MEQATILNNHHNIYWEETQLNNTDLNNKLFCTFVTEDILEEMVSSISNTYTIMYNKMFVLFVKSTNEYVITYNVDQGNINDIPDNTILVHRKKDSNTLYTINALNELIKKWSNLHTQSKQISSRLIFSRYCIKTVILPTLNQSSKLLTNQMRQLTLP